MLSRILVADDSEAIQKAIRLAFQRYDVTIYEATSYVETLNICKKYHPELIVVDACLTGTDGPGDFQNIVAVAGNIPLILLEGSFEPVDREAFKALGLNCMIKKPFDQGEFLDLLQNQLSFELTAGQPVFNEDPDSGVTTNQPPIPLEPTETIEGMEGGGPREESKPSVSGAESANLPPPPPLSENQDGMFARPGAESPPPPPSFDANKDAFSQAIESTFSSAGFRAEPVYSKGGVDMAGSNSGTPSQNQGGGRMTQPEQNSHDRVGAGGQSSDGISGYPVQSVKEIIQSEVRELVKEAVEEYCRLYFKPLLKEFVSEELRKLAHEQSRQMTDP